MAGSLPVGSAALIVLDGWGLAADGPGNAVSLATTPVFDSLWERYPTTTLTASGLAVGLPDGQMGNSEVGHLNLGAGSVVMQDLTRIDAAAADGSMASNPVLRDALGGAERVHVIGLVSDGGVHSSLDHLHALISLAASLEVPDLVVHAFTDGRDTLPRSGAGFLASVEGWMADAGVGRIGSVVGRYYAMDRDNRWDRVKLAYDMLVRGEAPYRADSGEAAARAAYERDETDEFIAPTLVGSGDARIRPGDSVVGLNFRPDRMREITLALASEAFDGFDRGAGSAGGDALRDDDRVRGGLAVPGRVRTRAPGNDDRCRDRGPGRASAARRRDREVPACHVFLQRRRGGPVRRRGAGTGAVAA